MRFLAIWTMMLLACCGTEDEPVTWGDMNDLVVPAFCNARQRCFPDYYTDERTQYCKDHSMFHLCAGGSCDKPVNGDEDEALQVAISCSEGLDAIQSTDLVGCWDLVPGYLPQPACADYFDYQPKE